MKNVLAVSKLYDWRIVQTKNWYKLQNCNGLWWSTVTQISFLPLNLSDSEEFFESICDDWSKGLDLIWVDYI